MTMLAPSAASASAIALPMPLLPPVTIATLPSRLMVCWLLGVAECVSLAVLVEHRRRSVPPHPNEPRTDSPRSTRGAMNAFPPIADYAFLSDCEVSALVAPDGSVEWLCLPRPDSPSLFGSLLDRSAGFFRFGPANSSVPDQRRYVPGTMVLETTWHTPTGWMTIEGTSRGRRAGRERRAAGALPPRTRRLVSAGNAAPHRDVLQRAGRGADRLPPALRLRRHRRRVELRRQRLRATPPHARGPVADDGKQYAARHRRCARVRTHDAARRRVGIRRPLVGWHPPPHSKRRTSAA